MLPWRGSQFLETRHLEEGVSSSRGKHSASKSITRCLTSARGMVALSCWFLYSLGKLLLLLYAFHQTYPWRQYTTQKGGLSSNNKDSASHFFLILRRGKIVHLMQGDNSMFCPSVQKSYGLLWTIKEWWQSRIVHELSFAISWLRAERSRTFAFLKGREDRSFLDMESKLAELLI